MSNVRWVRLEVHFPYISASVYRLYLGKDVVGSNSDFSFEAELCNSRLLLLLPFHTAKARKWLRLKHTLEVITFGFPFPSSSPQSCSEPAFSLLSPLPLCTSLFSTFDFDPTTEIDKIHFVLSKSLVPNTIPKLTLIFSLYFVSEVCMRVPRPNIDKDWDLDVLYFFHDLMFDVIAT
jgi:hypothetical protein